MIRNPDLWQLFTSCARKTTALGAGALVPAGGCCLWRGRGCPLRTQPVPAASPQGTAGRPFPQNAFKKGQKQPKLAPVEERWWEKRGTNSSMNTKAREGGGGSAPLHSTHTTACGGAHIRADGCSKCGPCLHMSRGDVDHTRKRKSTDFTIFLTIPRNSSG